VLQFSQYGLTRKVGSLYVTALDSDFPEVGVYIGEVTFHGQGLGTKAISLAVDWLKENNFHQGQAIIQASNVPSQRAFASVGFLLVEQID
jgi:RimJ/RimL family protein N-acetyltransferase